MENKKFNISILILTINILLSIFIIFWFIKAIWAYGEEAKFSTEFTRRIDEYDNKVKNLEEKMNNVYSTQEKIINEINNLYSN